MNKKVKQFKLKNTNFANSHGLANRNNYSCCNDMAKLSLRAIQI